MKASTFFCKVTGHELIEITETKGRGKFRTKDSYTMLKVTLRGTGDDKKTRVSVLVDTTERENYPLGDTGEVRFEIRQQKLPFKGAKPTSAEKAH